MEFRKEIEAIINRHSKENGSNTPDFILAQFLEECLMLFDKTVRQREIWHGRDAHLSDCAVHNAPAYPPGPSDCI